MKTVMRAGAELDIPTLDEIRSVIHKHANAIKNAMIPQVKYRRVTIQINADGTGAASTVTQSGPEPGFLWDVKRIVVTNGAGTGGLAVYVNDVNPSSLCYPTINANSYVAVGDEEFVLQPGDKLAFAGTTLGANSVTTVNLQVKEVSINHIGDLSF